MEVGRVVRGFFVGMCYLGVDYCVFLGFFVFRVWEVLFLRLENRVYY